jgi:hypothetical protein
MRRAVLVFCLLSATSCLGNSPSSPTPDDRRVVLAPGESAAVASRLTVGFVGVFGDSRCPADALCVQGGDAIVRIRITQEQSQAELDLHTGDMKPVSFDDVRIELVRLDPYPFSSRTIQPEEYRATLLVTSGSD